MEQFIITTTGGNVLFDHRFTKINIKVMNQFIADKMAEKAVVHDSGLLALANRDNHSMYYLTFRDVPSALEVHFNLVFSSIYNISAEKTYHFLSDLKTLFMGLVFEDAGYDEYSFVQLLHEKADAFEKFNQFFNVKAKEYSTNLSEKESESPETTRESTPTPVKPKAKAVKGKKLRNWDTGDEKFIDFSDFPTDKDQKADDAKLQSMFGGKDAFGAKAKDGKFLVRSLNEEMNTILEKGLKNTDESEQPSGMVSGFFQKYVTGGKTITKDDMNSISQKILNHLIAKNITQETANKLVAKIQEKLVGSKTPSFTSLNTIFKSALNEELTKILSPTISVDLLNDIKKHLREKPGQPYVLAVVGVNGVGKSTNLSKIAYWLLQNDYRVLITACDTFRSGAVQQLKVHVDNLKSATCSEDGEARIELFEKGYGDASLVTKVAKASIEYASKNDFQIVLMDTAGRAHTNDQLMASLLAFGNAANPNKIIMVGEALTGNDSVAQAQNFNKAFGSKRHIDFFLVSKCDTVDKSIGTIVNLVTSIGAPVLFVGVGQTYTDLRTLSVDWAVNLLMED